MPKVLITGGAGFVGSNLADAFLSAGYDVAIYDGLARPGTKFNAQWLREKHPKGLTLVQEDIRDFPKLREAARGAQLFYHLAAQVAVTTSVADPRLDFEVNALGTLNALEAARASGTLKAFVFTSTNKVYGGMEELNIAEGESRYICPDYPQGIPEEYPLDFHSPYGCSKGAADQYVRDYSRIYDLPTVVFRMSCIYGPRQFGTEDQGWLAHFVISTQKVRPITIYGDGKQVRDVLYVDDLVQALLLAGEHIEVTRGQIYNMGGGYENSISVWREFQPILRRLIRVDKQVTYREWRPGDQKVYISDTSRFQSALGWRPQVSPAEGIERLYRWVEKSLALIP